MKIRINSIISFTLTIIYYLIFILFYKYWWNTQDFFLLLKDHIFIACSEDTIFIFHMRGYWCRHGY